MTKSLPFSIANVFEGLAEAHGVVAFDGERLRIEFQTRDSLFGVLKSKVRTIELPLSEIEEVALKSGRFTTRLVIRTSNFAAVTELSRQDAGEIRLSIARENRAAAAEFASSLDFEIADRRLRSARMSLDAPASLSEESLALPPEPSPDIRGEV